MYGGFLTLLTRGVLRKCQVFVISTVRAVAVIPCIAVCFQK